MPDASVPLPANLGPLAAAGVQLTDGLPRNFASSFRAVEDSDTLIVTLSPTGAFIFSNVFVRQNLLCLADRQKSYFTLNVERAIPAILDFLARTGIRRLIFVGSSKGGFGALLLAGRCAQAMPERAVHCLAFGPPTLLFPENPALMHIPSYGRMMVRQAESGRFREALLAHGDVRFIQTLRNVHVVIAYAEGCEMDVIEAGRLCGPTIRKLPVPYPRHGAITPITLRGRTPAGIRRTIENMLRANAKDADQEAAMAGQADDLVEWIAGNRWLPSLPELVDQVLSVDPFA